MEGWFKQLGIACTGLRNLEFLHTRFTFSGNAFDLVPLVITPESRLQSFSLVDVRNEDSPFFRALLDEIVHNTSLTRLRVDQDWRSACVDITGLVDKLSRYNWTLLEASDLTGSDTSAGMQLQTMLSRNRARSWPVIRGKLADLFLALAPLELPAYVILWISDWCPEFDTFARDQVSGLATTRDVLHGAKIRSLQKMYSARRRLLALRTSMLRWRERSKPTDNNKMNG